MSLRLVLLCLANLGLANLGLALTPTPAVAAPATPAAPAVVQKPTKGDWYEETQRFGFRVRVPKDWRYVPSEMKDEATIAKYVPENNDSVIISGMTSMALFHWIVAFDLTSEREKFDAKVAEMLEQTGAEDESELPEELLEDLEKERAKIAIEPMLLRWVQRNERSASGYELVEEGEIKLDKDLYALERVYEGTTTTYGETEDQRQEYPIRVYMAVVELSPGKHIMLAFNSLGEKSKYKKSERYFTKMVKTFERLEMEIAAEAEEAGGPSNARAEKRKDLEKSLAGMPGWWMAETENYFLVTDSDDEKFIEEIGVRLEAIRKIYETDYPADKARRVAEPTGVAAAGGPSAPGADGEDGEDGEAGADGEDGEPARRGGGDTVVAKSSMDQSRLSVVRVCSDRDMYLSYGAPPSSAGYWISYHEELVLYDDRKRGGRRNTYAVLNHEAFHQYIYYFYGSLAPHSWYNEGTGDYYAGYEFNKTRKTFKLTEFEWRRELAKKSIREDNYVPLSEIVYWDQSKYYGNNDYGLDGGANYAQGWSFIFFLRQGKGKPKKWNDDWNDVLEVYLDELARTGDLDAATDEAFKDVDWDELEEAWMNYMG